MHGHLRVARATSRLDALLPFYRDALGFEIVGEFRDHEGFDGIMLGHPGAAYHLEFTQERGAPPERAPGPESLLVFYLPEADEWARATARLAALGHQPLPSHNPYWDNCGLTYEDPDGYRVVLCRDTWPGG